MQGAAQAQQAYSLIFATWSERQFERENRVTNAGKQ